MERIIRKLFVISFLGSAFQTIISSELPNSLIFFNATGETIIITSPIHQKIEPGKSFTLAKGLGEISHMRWYIPQNFDTGIYISHAVFAYKENTLAITELYDENPLGINPVLRSFKRILPLGPLNINFTLIKNSRFIDVELQD